MRSNHDDANEIELNKFPTIILSIRDGNSISINAYIFRVPGALLTNSISTTLHKLEMAFNIIQFSNQLF